jgi:microcystin-dependent protein
MKSKLLFLTALMLIAVFGSFAQITTTGIAIQGIARDATTNNAITNSTIGLKFTVYYGATPVNAIPSVTPTVTTDAFGVFSYTLDVSEIENKIIYDNQLMLKIEQTSPSIGVISDEKLNFVPYAVSASNGVPTGSIMPFIGTTVPRGWWLCDGSTLPSTATELKALLGGSTTAPDLRGMFMRGAGTNSNNLYSSNVGPAVKAIQTDAIKTHIIPPHNHAITDPGHTHPYNDIYWSETSMGTTLPGGYNLGAGSNQGTDYNNSGLQWERTTSSSSTGISINNSAAGTTTYTGENETRPINYGVNYIIKL